MGGFLVAVVVILFFSFALLIVYGGDKRKVNRKTKLPPGSMGWPYIGETLLLYSIDPNIFWTSKQKRFDRIFSIDRVYIYIKIEPI